MSIQMRDPMIDPERSNRIRPPDRVYYAEGVLLDAGDFTAEQSYHRGRLAQVLTYLHGSGTIAGLRVLWEAALDPGDDADFPEGREERLRVEPGLAVDALGRLIESRRDVCIRLDRWYDGRTGDALNQSLAGNPVDRVTADVFIRFVSCERGKTPAFASGAYDATDAVVPSRIRDAYEVELVLRTEPTPQLPDDPWDAIDPAEVETERRRQLKEALLDRWRGPEEVLRQREHPLTLDPASVFLARVLLPAELASGDVVRITTESVEVDNHSRRFVTPSRAIARWLGI